MASQIPNEVKEASVQTEKKPRKLKKTLPRKALGDLNPNKFALDPIREEGSQKPLLLSAKHVSAIGKPMYNAIINIFKNVKPQREQIPEEKGEQEEKEEVLPFVDIPRDLFSSEESRRLQTIIYFMTDITKTKKSDDRKDFVDVLYDPDYYQENLEYMLSQEKDFELRPSALKTIHSTARTITVVWLSHIQEFRNLAEVAFLKAVRMFDEVLVLVQCKDIWYPYLAIACLVIALKIECSSTFMVLITTPAWNDIPVSRLARHFEPPISVQVIYLTEKLILSVLNFKFHYPDPGAFLFYYLHGVHLEQNHAIRSTALSYIMCYSKVLNYSCTKPSKLAAAALCCTLEEYHGTDQYRDTAAYYQGESTSFVELCQHLKETHRNLAALS